jgi:exodeoxyribonuclease VII large subunit
MQHIASPKTSKARHVFTISEITQDIKLLLESTFTEIWVEGEVSGLTRIATGTVFFNLKDAGSILKCVMFFSVAAGVKFEIKDGMQLVCFGRIGVYEKDGRYQFYAQAIEPKGIGSLQLALEQLKEKLEKEGLFRKEHKRAIPYLPSRIGIVTSLTGAAIKDILKVLDRRFSDVHVIIRPTLVQGEGAKEDIAQAIEEFNCFNDSRPPQEHIEVMIVGRGGGSIEDLWAFNEEIVARAIYHSAIPVISAVGHERDWTVADLVADMRAPTPSVAAELVMPKKEDLQEELDRLKESLAAALLEGIQGERDLMGDLGHRLNMGIENAFRLYASELMASHKKLTLLNPAARINEYIDKLNDLARQIYIRTGHFLHLRQAELATAAAKLSNLSPLTILSRGYSITFKLPEAVIVKDPEELKAGDQMQTRLHKGFVMSTVTEVKKNG